MNKIDFIKWKVDYADGFVNISDEIEDRIQLPTGDLIGLDELESDHWFKSIVDPLLTQKAIEGVNRDDHNIVIVQDDHVIDVVSYEFTSEFNIDDVGADQAKESALEYIFEQEGK